MTAQRRVVVGISGASGAAIGVRVVELLADAGIAVHLVVSTAAERTLRHEVGEEAFPRLADLAAVMHPVEDVGATIASGSFRTRGMIVAPCSVRTLSAIAASAADNLLVRAADVHLKERRRLVLMVRETPLHLGHIRAMAQVSEIGAVIAPPVPAFYRKPRTVEDIVEHTARRAIDLLDLEVDGLAGPEWAGDDG